MKLELDNLLGSELESLGRILNPVQSQAPTLREGENRFVSILFMDLQGFTELGERLHSEDVQQILDRVLTVFTNSIEKYGGYIDKYEGDLIMALFGSRSAGEKDSEHALLAGLKMLQDLPDVNRLLGTELKIRIGVNSGMVTTGRVGKKREGDFTVYGDAVNVAARMESNAPANGILITAATRELVADRFHCKDLGQIELKGKKDPVQVWQILREQIHAPLLLRKLSDEPFVGRSKELGRLTQVWQEFKSGSQAVLQIHLGGEAGCGKSRLLREFLQVAELPHENILVLRAGSTSARGWGLWQALLQEHFPLADPAQEEALRQVLGDFLQQGHPGQDQSSHEQDCSVLALLLGLPASRCFAESPPLERLEEWITLALRHFLEARARQAGQLVLLLEDQQECDESSQKILHHILRNWRCDSGNSGRLFFVALGRTQTITGLPGSLELCLADLSNIESRQLLELLLQTERLPRKLADLLLPRGTGNPWMLKEQLHWLRERGLLEYNQDQWRLQDAAQESVLPQGVQQVLLSRIDLLPPARKLSLQMAAVLGDSLSRKLLLSCLAELSDVSHPQEEVAALLQTQWLQENPQDQDKLDFASTLAAEAALSCLLRHNKRLLHLLAGRQAEELFGTEPARSAQIALHYFAAADHEMALLWLRKARANCDPATPPALQIELTRSLLSLSKDAKEQCTLALQLAHLLESQGSWPRALEYCTQAAQSSTPEMLADVLHCKARLQALTGQTDTALSTLKLAFERAAGAGKQELSASILVEEARLHRIRGNFKEATARYRKALALLSDTALRQVRADCLNGLGAVLCWTGEAREGQDLLQQAEQLYTQLGDLRGQAGCHQSLGDQFRLRGNWADARDCYRRTIAVCRELGLREGEAAARRSLGDLSLMQKDSVTAAEELSLSLELFEEIQDQHGRAIVHRSLGHLARLARDFAKAEQHFSTSHRLRIQLQDRRGAALALLDLGQLAGSRKDYTTALTLSQQAATQLREMKLVAQLAQCLRMAAEYHMHLQQFSEAAARLHEAIMLFRQQEDRRYLALCLLQLARCTSGKEPAPAELAEACDTFKELGMAEEQQACRNFLDDHSL